MTRTEIILTPLLTPFAEYFPSTGGWYIQEITDDRKGRWAGRQGKSRLPMHQVGESNASDCNSDKGKRWIVENRIKRPGEGVHGGGRRDGVAREGAPWCHRLYVDDCMITCQGCLTRYNLGFDEMTE